MGWLTAFVPFGLGENILCLSILIGKPTRRFCRSRHCLALPPSPAWERDSSAGRGIAVALG